MEPKPGPETEKQRGWFRQLSVAKQVWLVGGSVVVVLLVLAILVPTYGRVKEKGRQASVMNSLTQGGRGVANYGELDERSGPAAAPARMAYAPDEDAAKSGAAPSYTSLETWGRKLILSSAIALEVKDVRLAYDRVQLVAAREGALVTNASLKATSGDEEDGDDYGHATLVLRVPQGRFHAVRQRLLGLADDLDGRVLKDEVSSQDVTEEYVDLEGRLRHWRAQETQLLETMRKARLIKDILAVRDNLSKVQQEIERLGGRLRFLENRVDLSTITLEIYQKGKAPAEPTIVAHWKNAGKAIAGAFKKALVDVVYVLGMIGVILTYLLPFVFIAVVIWLAIRAARKRAPSRAPGS